MRSRALLAAMASGLALTLLSTSTPVLAASPADPIKWGATVQPNTGETKVQARHRIQNLVGRNFGAVRDFLFWDSPFPTSYETGLTSEGATILLSVKSRRQNGVDVKWADVAAATPGSPLYAAMVSWADRVKAYGQPIYVTFNHEPEAAASKSLGTQAEFIAAWRNWVQVFRDRNVTQAKMMWITTAFAYTVSPGDRRLVTKWWPGDAWVDAIGTDAYNWFTCRPGINNPWNSLETLLEPVRQFSLSHPGKELWVAEYASVEDPAQPNRRSQWLADAQALFKKPGWERFRGILYYHQNRQCDWRLDSSPAALDAWSAMGADPSYAG